MTDRESAAVEEPKDVKCKTQLPLETGGKSDRERGGGSVPRVALEDFCTNVPETQSEYRLRVHFWYILPIFYPICCAKREEDKDIGVMEVY